MSMEWARSDNHRGFIASWPQFGGSIGSPRRGHGWADPHPINLARRRLCNALGRSLGCAGE
jgi:hypothetical protein